MKSRSHLPQFYALLSSITILFGINLFTNNSRYEIASSEYEEITEDYLNHIANFEWEKSFKYLSDKVEFKLPDGDTENRTAIKGLDNLKAFWNSYVENSGNDKLSISNYVHIPIKVNEVVDHIGVTGVFNLCYFSAELSYGSETANVRMHWAFHFDDNKKIDGIYAYYDRTPIIEAARKNFLQTSDNVSDSNGNNVVQIVKIKSGLSEDQLIKTATNRADNFRAMPGLIQKFYVQYSEPGYYGGIFIWDSKEDMMNYAKSEIASTMTEAYDIQGTPDVQFTDILFSLRE